MLDIKVKTNDEIKECSMAQAEFCKKTASPHFAPSSGVCWRCNRNIYQNIGWSKGHRVSLEEAERVTGVSFQEAATGLVTGCPHCNRSYCD